MGMGGDFSEGAAKPRITEESLCSYLDKPAFRGSFGRSLSTLVQTLALMGTWWLIAPGIASPTARALLSVAWGLLVLRSYMIFHDCGHKSFFQGGARMQQLNWATLQLTAVLCGTPTDWNVGHQLHHANVGNLGQDEYDWGETIFHTASQFVALPRWKQRLWKVARHPVPFFVLAPLLTWYVKMRLPFELRPERKSAYRFFNKAISTMALLLRYAAAARLGVLAPVFAGDYLAMTAGVLLFHWQHVYDTGYVRDAHQWKLKDAAMSGSSLAVVPAPLKYFTLGIEYHHIHHFRTRIPGYMLRTVHEQAPAGAFGAVHVLGVTGMWRSLFLQCYDEASGRYITFGEAQQQQLETKAA